MDNIFAKWAAPKNISLITTYKSWNIDKTAADFAQKNLQLKATFKLPVTPLWLKQNHSNKCVFADAAYPSYADACISFARPIALVTADCLPIMLCDKKGEVIVAIHAGWRGLANNIIEKTIANLAGRELIAWIGPAICGKCYEVGSNVITKFAYNYKFANLATIEKSGKFFFDLALMANLILKNCGVKEVFQAKYCTLELKNEFFSYRREPDNRRNVTLIWFSKR